MIYSNNKRSIYLKNSQFIIIACCLLFGSCTKIICEQSESNSTDKRGVDQVFLRPFCDTVDRVFVDDMISKIPDLEKHQVFLQAYFNQTLHHGCIDPQGSACNNHNIVTQLHADIAIGYYGLNYHFKAGLLLYDTIYAINKGEEPSISYIINLALFDSCDKSVKLPIIREFIRQHKQHNSCIAISVGTLSVYDEAEEKKFTESLEKEGFQCNGFYYVL